MLYSRNKTVVFQPACNYWLIDFFFKGLMQRGAAVGTRGFAHPLPTRCQRFGRWAQGLPPRCGPRGTLFCWGQGLGAAESPAEGCWQKGPLL